MAAMFASSCRLPAAGLRSFRRSICSALSSTPSAPVLLTPSSVSPSAGVTSVTPFGVGPLGFAGQSNVAVAVAGATLIVGVAVAAAAFLCNRYDTTPRGLYDEHLSELRNLVDQLTGHDHDMRSKPPVRKFVAVPG